METRNKIDMWSMACAEVGEQAMKRAMKRAGFANLSDATSSDVGNIWDSLKPSHLAALGIFQWETGTETDDVEY